MTDEMATARKENGDLLYGFGVILNYLFREDELEEYRGSSYARSMWWKRRSRIWMKRAVV